MSAPPRFPAQPGSRRAARRAAAWIFGIAGLLAYNWWVLVLLRPGLMRSPSELFSNLEVTGQPFAAGMQHADLLSGLLLAGAFLTAGSRSVPDGWRDWLGMTVFAASGALGGLCPEACADEISARCRTMEWSFQLPVQQYVHIVAGILEFGGITVALVLAFRRTRGGQGIAARAYRDMAIAAVAAYPLLGAAYMLNSLGGVMEAVFFTGFTVIVLTQLYERTSPGRCRRPDSEALPGASRTPPGTSATQSGPVSRAPSASSPTATACATAATGDSRRPTSSTSSPPVTRRKVRATRHPRSVPLPIATAVLAVQRRVNGRPAVSPTTPP